MTSADDLKQLAPAGKLRGGVVVAPAASAFFAIKDDKGAVRGVTVDLLRAFAAKLKLPLDLQVFSNSGQVTDAVANAACDLAFMPQDAERAKKSRFRPGLLLHRKHLSGAGGLENPKHRRGQPAGRAHRRHLQHHHRAQRAPHRAQRRRRGSAERRSDDRDGGQGRGRRLRAVARLRSPACCRNCRARACWRAISSRPASPSPCPRAAPARSRSPAACSTTPRNPASVRRALDAAGFKDAVVAP